MIFLNGIALGALATIAVPIVIHLRKRKKAKVVDWAAMQFLSQSIANRRQGVALEHLLLLLCRCLLVTFFVLAMARPMVSSLAEVKWIGALVIGIAGLVFLVHSVVHQQRKRWTSLAVSMVLFICACIIAFLDEQPQTVGRGQPKDVAIVIDSSSSMKINVDGRSNFDRAIDEAKLLVDELPTGSTVSVVEAGPIIKTLTSAPLTNLRRAATVVGEQENVGGSTSILDAVEHAKRIIGKGLHSNKQIVLFTDNQLRPWQIADDRHASEPPIELVNESIDPEAHSKDSGSNQAIEVFGRSYKLPSKLEDIAIAGLSLQDGVLGINRPVQIDVELSNSGTGTHLGVEIELLVDGKQVDKRSIGQLEANSKRTESFSYSFPSPGFHTIEARRIGDDDLADDNAVYRVVHVRSQLPILLVNGDVTSPPFEKSATFAQLALDPLSLRNSPDQTTNRILPIDRIEAAEFESLKNPLTKYQLVILCDVPRLPSTVAEKLARFVEAGGGLWIIPGKHCEPEFYNSWRIPDQSKNVLPAKLLKRSSRPADAQPFSIDLDSIQKRSFKRLIENGEHDLSELEIFEHWVLQEQPVGIPDLSKESDQPGRTPTQNHRELSSAQVAVRLTNGDPMLAEHSFGLGKVMLLAISLNHLENNFVQRLSFPVLMHVWAKNLAINQELDLNHRPTEDLTISLPVTVFPDFRNQQIKLRKPNDLLQEIHTSEANSRIEATLGEVSTPGVYWVSADDELRPKPSASDVPFSVSSNPIEFDLTPASVPKLSEFGERFQIKWLKNVDQLESVATGAPLAGIEIWKWLIFAALLMVVLESMVMRWVWSRRRAPIGQSNLATDNSKSSETPAQPLPSPVTSVQVFGEQKPSLSHGKHSMQAEFVGIDTGAER